MRRHLIRWLAAVLYMLVVGLWPAAAVPVELAAAGAFTLLSQPGVLLLAASVALVAPVRRSLHVPAWGH